MGVHATETFPAPATVPDGTRIYAVGDVHGQLGQLAELWREIARDAARATERRRLLIHLGDYVDRGPDSRGVIEALARSEWRAAMTEGGAGTFDAVALSGNHEAMMLDALQNEDDPDAARFWIENGGVATLRSYGLDPQETGRHAWPWGIEPSHLEFLRGLGFKHREGGYLFAHAGIRPGVAIESQDRHDLVWMREPFLSHAGGHGAVVVHGHTPSPTPVVKSNRIGIDTGAAFGGPLTCVVLWSGQMRFLAVGGTPRGR